MFASLGDIALNGAHTPQLARLGNTRRMKVNVWFRFGLPHKSEALLELFTFVGHDSGHVTSSKHMTCSVHRDACNGLARWASVVMVAALASCPRFLSALYKAKRYPFSCIGMGKVIT